MQYKKEKLLVLIPIHNYIEGVLKLSKFAKDNLNDLFGDNWEVCLIDNNSKIEAKNRLLDIAKHKNFKYFKQSSHSNLKRNLHLGYIYSKEFNPTIISIWETDAIPNLITFKAMLDLYLEEGNNIASISPMYKWNGHFCYPTHKHWHTDTIYKNHSLYGEITKVHAIPFLFSLWAPESLEYINRTDFRSFVHLDSDFGAYLSKLGKLHLRMKEYSVDHFNGGRMTRG